MEKAIWNSVGGPKTKLAQLLFSSFYFNRHQMRAHHRAAYVFMHSQLFILSVVVLSVRYFLFSADQLLYNCYA